MAKRNKKYCKWVVCVISLLVFGAMVTLLVTNNLSNFDSIAYDLIISIKSDVMTWIMMFITMLSNSEFIIVATLLLVLLNKNKKKGAAIATNVVMCSGINVIVKHIFLRERPVGLKLIEQGGYSFPSGHAMMSLAFYGLIIYMIWKTKWDKSIKFVLTTLLSIIILMIGVSRIYLGVHFTSDVIAGFALSLSYLIIFIQLIYKRITKKS